MILRRDLWPCGQTVEVSSGLPSEDQHRLSPAALEDAGLSCAPRGWGRLGPRDPLTGGQEFSGAFWAGPPPGPGSASSCAQPGSQSLRVPRPPAILWKCLRAPKMLPLVTFLKFISLCFQITCAQFDSCLSPWKKHSGSLCFHRKGPPCSGSGVASYFALTGLSAWPLCRPPTACTKLPPPCPYNSGRMDFPRRGGPEGPPPMSRMGPGASGARRGLRDPQMQKARPVSYSIRDKQSQRPRGWD